MKLTKEELDLFLGKNVLIITEQKFTYNCLVLSYGEDYMKVRDKYDTLRFITLEEIKIIEVLG